MVPPKTHPHTARPCGFLAFLQVDGARRSPSTHEEQDHNLGLNLDPQTWNLPAVRRRPRRFLPVLLLLGLLVGFGMGLAALLQLRLSGGDVLPPYSTLRADALGAKAFHDALAELPGLRVERGYRPWRRLFAPGFTLPGERNRPVSASEEGSSLRKTTLFVLGLEPERWPYLLDTREMDTLEDLARRGLRVVLTFRPARAVPTTQNLRHLREAEEERQRRQREARERRRQGGETGGRREEQRDDADEDGPFPGTDPDDVFPADFFPVDVGRRWGLDFYRVRLDGSGRLPKGYLPPPDPSVATPAAGTESVVGTDTVSWHSVADWDADAPDAKTNSPPGIWRALLRRNRGRAVLVERPFGEGSLALATDSFFLSNEALAGDERHAALLAGLVGPRARRVIFDERHLGLAENPGLMTLARRYRLDGALAALGLLVGLFLWRSTTSLAPPRPEPTDDAALAGNEGVTGREASAGFGALLRRGVPVGQLVPTLLARWEAAHARPTSAARVARLREIAAGPERRHPAKAYRAMREALKGKV